MPGGLTRRTPTLERQWKPLGKDLPDSLMMGQGPWRTGCERTLIRTQLLG